MKIICHFKLFRAWPSCVQSQAKRGDLSLDNNLESNVLFFSRTKGLFRICFEDKKVPKGGQLYYLLLLLLLLLIVPCLFSPFLFIIAVIVSID